MINTALSAVSKKLNIDAHYLYRGFLWMGIATCIIFAINFAKSYVFANYLRPETFGTYRYIMTLIDVASTLTLTGITLVISRSVAQGYEGTYIRGVYSYLTHSYLALATTTAIAVYYAYAGNYTFAFVIGTAGVLNVGINAARLYGSVLEGKKRSDINARYQMVSNTIPSLVMIASVFMTDSLTIIIILYFVTTLTIHTILSIYTYRRLELNSSVDDKAQKFSLHLSIMGILSTGAEHIDKLLLFQMLGPAQLALYSFAAALPEQFNVIGKSLRVLIYPKISAQSFENTKKHVLRKSGLILAVCLVMFTGYVVIAPFIFTHFFSTYIGAITLSQVYALSILLIAATPYKSILLAHSCTKELYQTKLVLIITRLLLLALLLPLYGVWGIVASFLIARFTEALLYVYAVHIGITKIPTTQLASQQSPQEEQSLVEL